LDFIEVVEKLLDSGVAALGNGIDNPNPFAYKNLQSIFQFASSDWYKEISPDFIFKTIRGSFFAISTDTINIIKKLEVLWEIPAGNLKLGNISELLTCAKVTHFLGFDSIQFLSNTWRQSEYLIEGKRGDIFFELDI